MQINRFTKIVIFVTSFGFTFFSCIALFLFVSFAFRFIVLLLLLECAWGFRSCGSDEDAVPRPCKPLKRLDRNFKCFGAVTFVWLIGFCAMLAPRLLSLDSQRIWARLNKKQKIRQSMGDSDGSFIGEDICKTIRFCIELFTAF